MKLRSGARPNGGRSMEPGSGARPNGGRPAALRSGSRPNGEAGRCPPARDYDDSHERDHREEGEHQGERQGEHEDVSPGDCGGARRPHADPRRARSRERSTTALGFARPGRSATAGASTFRRRRPRRAGGQPLAQPPPWASTAPAPRRRARGRTGARIGCGWRRLVGTSSPAGPEPPPNPAPKRRQLLEILVLKGAASGAEAPLVRIQCGAPFKTSGFGDRAWKVGGDVGAIQTPGGGKSGGFTSRRPSVRNRIAKRFQEQGVALRAPWGLGAIGGDSIRSRLVASPAAAITLGAGARTAPSPPSTCSGPAPRCTSSSRHILPHQPAIRARSRRYSLGGRATGPPPAPSCRLHGAPARPARRR